MQRFRPQPCPVQSGRRRTPHLDGSPNRAGVQGTGIRLADRRAAQPDVLGIN